MTSLATDRRRAVHLTVVALLLTVLATPGRVARNAGIMVAEHRDGRWQSAALAEVE